MKRILIASALLTTVMFGGCITYLDNPSIEEIAGVVIDAESGEPVKNAYVSVWSRRKYLLFPGMEMVKSGFTQTDNTGRFAMQIKDIFPIHLQVEKNGKVAQAIIPIEDKDRIHIDLPNDFRIFKRNENIEPVAGGDATR